LKITDFRDFKFHERYIVWVLGKKLEIRKQKEQTTKELDEKIELNPGHLVSFSNDFVQWMGTP